MDLVPDNSVSSHLLSCGHVWRRLGIHTLSKNSLHVQDVLVGVVVQWHVGARFFVQEKYPVLDNKRVKPLFLKFTLFQLESSYRKKNIITWIIT